MHLFTHLFFYPLDPAVLFSIPAGPLPQVNRSQRGEFLHLFLRPIFEATIISWFFRVHGQQECADRLLYAHRLFELRSQHHVLL